MISFAELVAVASLVGAAPVDTVPTAFEERVRTEVAARWRVDAERLRLEWGLVPSRLRLDSIASLRVAGESSDGWMVVVATPGHGASTALRVHAGLVGPVTIAARALEAGKVLVAEDLAVEERVRWGAPREAVSVVGFEVRRAVPAGDALLPTMVIAPRVIAAGDAVTLVWARGGVRMEAEGVALTAARLGEMVYARVGANRLAGTVTGPGMARLEEKTR